MTDHLHPTPVPGCYRCDLREHEGRDHGDDLDLGVIEASVRAAWAAAAGDSTDDEIEALQDALGHTPALIAEVRALHARLAAVEALVDPDYPPPPPDERGAAGWRFAMDHVRAALETDTTKEN